VIDIDELYFDWLLRRIDPNGVAEGVAYLSGLLHNCPFERRVGKDINRAADGANLRKEFLMDFDELDIEPAVTNDFMMLECSWFEMLVALSRTLDHLYDGGVDGRYFELISNLQLGKYAIDDPNRSEGQLRREQRAVRNIVSDVDNNRFEASGHGGLFPLHHPEKQPDQRRVEIWDQHSAYFRERLEGVLWTSTS
jgi:hypothetical protein